MKYSTIFYFSHGNNAKIGDTVTLFFHYRLKVFQPVTLIKKWEGLQYLTGDYV